MVRASFVGLSRAKVSRVARIIYYWFKPAGQIVLLAIHGKGEQETLSAADLKRIAKLIEELR